MSKNELILKIETTYAELSHDMPQQVAIPRYTQLHHLTPAQRSYLSYLAQEHCKLFLNFEFIDPNRNSVSLDQATLEAFDPDQYLDWQVESIYFDDIEAASWISLHFNQEIKQLGLENEKKQFSFPLKILLMFITVMISFLICYLTINYDNSWIPKIAFAVGFCGLSIIWDAFKTQRKSKTEEMINNRIWIMAYDFSERINQIADTKFDLDTDEED